MAKIRADGRTFDVPGELGEQIALAVRRELLRRRDDNLQARVEAYYASRELKWPNTMEAMAFAETELAEAWELLLASVGGWLRNHPDAKAAYHPGKLARELGQAMMMCQVAGMVSGVDPMASLLEMLEAD